MANLANKTALVTGASRGMGRATALALAAAGARVIIHYGRNADEAKTVVDQIRATAGRADAVAADLAAPDGAHVLAAQVRNLIGNRFDIFVSNAGISKAAPIESITVKDFDDLFAVNVRAPYFLLQQLLPILGEGGSVVFVSSLGARAAVGTLSAYAATKGAIDTLVKYFAAALGPRGIRVNTVNPATTETPGLMALYDADHHLDVEQFKAQRSEGIPLGRLATTDEVANAAVFLASGLSSFTTGAALPVDGGYNQV